MDPITIITSAIVASLSAGALSGLTEAGKATVVDAYNKLKDLLSKKFGATSSVVQSVNSLEAKPESVGRKGTLEEEIAAAKVEQDSEILATAKHILTLVNAGAGTGQFAIENKGPVGVQNIGNSNNNTSTNTQYMGFSPPVGKRTEE